MANVVRAITNHAPIGSYRQSFHLRDETLCNECVVLQSRKHILFECTKYRKIWEYDKDPRLIDSQKEALFMDFLKHNPSAFTFDDAPKDYYQMFLEDIEE